MLHSKMEVITPSLHTTRVRVRVRANESTTQGLWAPVDAAAWSVCTGLEFISLTGEFKMKLNLSLVPHVKMKLNLILSTGV